MAVFNKLGIYKIAFKCLLFTLYSLLYQCKFAYLSHIKAENIINYLQNKVTIVPNIDITATTIAIKANSLEYFASHSEADIE